MTLRIFLAYFIQVFSELLVIAIFIRVILSWIRPQNAGRFIQFINDITEPILGPFRKIIPRIGMMDISPIVAYLVIIFVSSLIINLLV